MEQEKDLREFFETRRAEEPTVKAPAKFHLDVHIRHVPSGEVRVYHEDYLHDVKDDLEMEAVDFIWDQGNYSCDCNRALFWALAAEPPVYLDLNSVACGDSEYAIDKLIIRETGEEL